MALMTVPLRPVPYVTLRWMARRDWLRRGDGLVAWLLAWGAAALVLGPGRVQAAAVWALVPVVAGALIQPVRVRWRPLSGWAALRLSRDLRPGDHAWYLGAREASLVVVTARHGVRLVIARPDLGQDEGLSVRRTRVFLVPCEPGGGPR
jgi:hypothetical protein